MCSGAITSRRLPHDNTLYFRRITPNGFKFRGPPAHICAQWLLRVILDRDAILVGGLCGGDIQPGPGEHALGIARRLSSSV